MAEIKLHRTDVEAQLEKYRRSGIPRPGLLRIIQDIGHGSPGRLKRLLFEIDEEDKARLSSGIYQPLPDPITKAAQTLSDEITKTTDEYFEVKQAELDERVEAFEQKKQLLLAQHETDEIEIDELKASISSLNKELEQSHEEVICITMQRANEVLLRESVQSQNDNNIEYISELKRALAGANRDAAKREKVLKDDAQRAQDTVIEMQAELNRQLRDKEAILTELQQQFASQSEYVRNELSSRDQAILKMTDDLKDVKAQRDEIKQSLTELLRSTATDRADFMSQIRELTSSLETITRSNLDIQNQNDILTERCATLERDLKEAESKIRKNKSRSS